MSISPCHARSTDAGRVHAALRALPALLALGLAVAAAEPARSEAASPVPTIYSVSVSPNVAHAGDAVKWDARVSRDVVSVTARVAVYSFSLYPVSRGHFGETFLIPKDVPPFFHGDYGITITAKTASGAQTSHYLTMSFR
jgi:hypothetical protein